MKSFNPLLMVFIMIVLVGCSSEPLGDNESTKDSINQVVEQNVEQNKEVSKEEFTKSFVDYLNEFNNDGLISYSYVEDDDILLAKRIGKGSYFEDYFRRSKSLYTNEDSFIMDYEKIKNEFDSFANSSIGYNEEVDFTFDNLNVEIYYTDYNGSLAYQSYTDGEFKEHGFGKILAYNKRDKDEDESDSNSESNTSTNATDDVPIGASALTLANYNKVEIGMTMQEVEQCIGIGHTLQSSSTTSSGTKIAIQRWEHQDVKGIITITFYDGYVESKTQVGLK